MVTTTANQPETFPQRAERAALARWKIETLTGLLGVDSLEKQAQMSQANQEAENKWARKQVWGETETQADSPKENQDMRGHILGDVTYPAPIVVNQPAPQPQQKQSLAPALALAALTAMVPATGAAGVIGYLLARQPAQPPAQVQEAKPQEYESFNLGLGRLEDFIKDGGK